MPRILIDNRPPQFVYDDSNKLSDGVSHFFQSLVQGQALYDQEKRAKEHEQLGQLWHDQDYELRKLQVEGMLGRNAAKANPLVNGALWKAATDQYTTTDPLGVRSVDHKKALDFYNRNALAHGIQQLAAVPDEPAMPEPPPAPAPPPEVGWIDRLKGLFSGSSAPAAPAITDSEQAELTPEQGAAFMNLGGKPMQGPPAPAPEQGLLSRLFSHLGGDSPEMHQLPPEASVPGYGQPPAAAAAPAQPTRQQVFIQAFGGSPSDPQDLAALTSDDPMLVKAALVKMPAQQRLRAISALAAIHGKH